MNKMNKFFAIALSALSVLSMVACGTTGNSGNKTVITMVNFEGGVGTDWLDAAVVRFEAQNSGKSYESGKTGVDVKVTPAQGTTAYITTTSGYNLVVVERTSLMQYIQSGLLYDISDVVKDTSSGASIESRIDEGTLGRLQGNDGKYYGLPHYEFFSGLSYDRELFDEGYYFAADSSSGNTWNSSNYTGWSANFVDKNGVKSCGSDGIEGTQDDGLPSSLYELLLLCAKFAEDGIEPVQLTGKYLNESNYLMSGLWTALAGYDEIQTLYSFDSSSCAGQDGVKGTADDGKVEVLKIDNNGKIILTNENLFEGISYIKKPQTEWVEITQENGYLTNDLASKYYATAFLEILETENWLSADSDDDSVDHVAAEKNFIFGDYNGATPKAMLIEASYWWNESNMAGNMLDYTEIVEKEERDIRFMPLPTSLNVTATQGNGRKLTLADVGYATIVANANIKGKTATEDAVKDFLKFLYSEQECIAYTKSTGCMRPMNYTVEDKNSIDPFFADMLKLRENSAILGAGADNSIFKNNMESFMLELDGAPFKPSFGVGTMYNNYLTAIREKNATTQVLIENSRITESEWQSMK